ncbi:MAG TPA: ABC transporter ATP-binding protein [Chitinophagales bacterium]|nr:ABC transporter ATP-binding protein [Chitinophagales bacterium]
MISEIIKLNNVSKKYENLDSSFTYALKNVDLKVNEMEFISVIGMSGSGKTTLLRLIAKLEVPTEGTIQKNNSVGLNDKIGFVFQDNTIYPWFRVQDNIFFALKAKGKKNQSDLSKIDELMKIVGLEPSIFKNKYPKELSGGEKRRVAIAMALAHNAHLLLLDEPTSSLDDVNKWNFQETIQSIWLDKKFTCIMVTHDIDEAVFLGDQVLVLDGGKLKGTFQINLQRPRTLVTKESSEFLTYKKMCMEALK